MSAIRQIRARECEAASLADPETPNAVPFAGGDDPLQLLRAAIERLKWPDGNLPDHGQVADLLLEARQVLERASAIASAMRHCEAQVAEARFDDALAGLDAALLLYPADPTLATKRVEVERQRTAQEMAAAVRGAIAEAEWFLEQDRVDLAAGILREKTTGLPDQPALVSRLEELQRLLPLWEQKRQAQAALNRAATLEQLEQWQAALTVLEEALPACPDSEEVADAVERVRIQAAEHERQKKLKRRRESIRQKLAAQSWRQALTLLEDTAKEFPDLPEWDSLRTETERGLKRAECEALLAEAQQAWVDGELERAEQIVAKGLAAFGPEPPLMELSARLEAERAYGEGLRRAQLHFGRRQLLEAEQVLAHWAAPGRPEALALLEAVREARAATEEESFYERGRGKSQELMQQEQFAQAADLLRNLLLLYPGDPILERELSAAQSKLDRRTAEAIPPQPEIPEPSPQLVPPAQPEVDLLPSAPSRMRRVAIAGATSLLLVSAAGAAWKLTRNVPAVPAPPLAQTLAPPAQTLAPAPVDPQPEARETRSRPAVEPTRVRRAAPPAPPLRQFVPPAARDTAAVQKPQLLQPPSNAASVSTQPVPALPADIDRPLHAPAPPPAPAKQAPMHLVQPPAVGGHFQEARLIRRTLPDYPRLARERGIHGTISLSATIDERGNVTGIGVTKGDPILAAAAKRAVFNWKYAPANLNGRPIASTATIQVVFGERNQ